MNKSRKFISCAAALATALSLYTAPVFAKNSGPVTPVLYDDEPTQVNSNTGTTEPSAETTENDSSDASDSSQSTESKTDSSSESSSESTEQPSVTPPVQTPAFGPITTNFENVTESKKSELSSEAFPTLTAPGIKVEESAVSKKVFNIKSSTGYVEYSFTAENPKSDLETTFTWKSKTDGPTIDSKDIVVTVNDGTENMASSVKVNTDDKTDETEIIFPMDFLAKNQKSGKCKVTVGFKAIPSNDISNTKLDLEATFQYVDQTGKEFFEGIDEPVHAKNEWNLLLRLNEPLKSLTLKIDQDGDEVLKSVKSIKLDGKTISPKPVKDTDGSYTLTLSSDAVKKVKAGSLLLLTFETEAPAAEDQSADIVVTGTAETAAGQSKSHSYSTDLLIPSQSKQNPYSLTGSITQDPNDLTKATWNVLLTLKQKPESLSVDFDTAGAEAIKDLTEVFVGEDTSLTSDVSGKTLTLSEENLAKLNDGSVINFKFDVDLTGITDEDKEKQTVLVTLMNGTIENSYTTSFDLPMTGTTPPFVENDSENEPVTAHVNETGAVVQPETTTTTDGVITVKETIEVPVDQVVSAVLNTDNKTYTTSVQLYNKVPEKMNISVKADPDVFDQSAIKVSVDGNDLAEGDYETSQNPASTYNVNLTAAGLAKLKKDSKIDVTFTLTQNNFASLTTKTTVDNGVYTTDYDYTNKVGIEKPFTATHHYNKDDQTWTVTLILNQNPDKLELTFDQKQGDALKSPSLITLGGNKVTPEVKYSNGTYTVKFGADTVKEMGIGSKIEIVFPVDYTKEQTEKIEMNVNDGISTKKYTATFKVVKGAPGTNSPTASGSTHTSTDTGIIWAVTALVVAAAAFILFFFLSKKSRKADNK